MLGQNPGAGLVELLELHQVGLSLEEVFIRVVTGEEQAPQILETVVEEAR